MIGDDKSLSVILEEILHEERRQAELLEEVLREVSNGNNRKGLER